MPAQLVMRRGPKVGQTFPVSGDIVMIGRGMRNHVIIDDNEVSRDHCRLSKVDNGYELCDLNSRNGTFVNGQRVNDCWELKHNDLIELGDSITLEYQVVTSQMDETETGIPYLVVAIEGQPNRTVHPLQGETILIGRGTMNDIIILEPEMSRLHLKLVRSGSGYSVQDVGSTNGSKLNDVELTAEMPIQPGDIIRIGQTITMYYTMTPDQLLDRRQATTVLQDRTDTGTVRLQTGAPRIPTLTDRLKATGVGTGLSSGALVNHLFMAYTRSDWETKVAPVFNRLYDAQMAVWVEQYLPVGSDDWRLAIDQARLECWGLIVIATFAAMRSPFVQQVVRHFNNREKPIFVVADAPDVAIPVNGPNVHRVVMSHALPELSIQQLIQLIKRHR
ncbi:MAG: FHA domain-containing protein [Chloroflexi bacterium]|nr:FHA domain-containing protein [Chloroflexota bacterium]